MRRRGSEAASAPCRGFTLNEVLMALTILTVGLLGVAGITYRAIQLLGEARFLDVAATRAEEAADSLRSRGFAGPGAAEVDPTTGIRWEEARGPPGAPDGSVAVVEIVVTREEGEGAEAYRVRLIVERRPNGNEGP